jgi:hypothetical protein
MRLWQLPNKLEVCLIDQYEMALVAESGFLGGPDGNARREAFLTIVVQFFSSLLRFCVHWLKGGTRHCSLPVRLHQSTSYGLNLWHQSNLYWNLCVPHPGLAPM